MRVAINAEQLLAPSPGGIGRYSAELLRWLPALGGDDLLSPFVARHQPAAIRAAWQAAGLDCDGNRDGDGPLVLPWPRSVLYESWNWLGMPPVGWGFPALAAAEVVHAPSVAVPPAGRAALVVTVHDAAPLLLPETFPRHGRWFHRRGLAVAAQRADAVITVSHSAADDLASHSPIGAGKLRIVHNGVDQTQADDASVTAARRRYGLGDQPYVLWLGSLEPRKNVGVVVAAMDRLHRSGATDACLVLAGYPGWLPHDALPGVEGGPPATGNAGGVSMTGAADAPGWLRQVGLVGDSVRRALVAGAELFAFPSRYEGFGLPVLEAMVQATPVVAADIAALREISGGAAVLVEPSDVAAWANTLADLLGTGAAAAHQRDQLARAGRAQAARFTWEATARATRDVYREVVG